MDQSSNGNGATTRRAYLRGVGAAGGTVALAGCLGGWGQDTIMLGGTMSLSGPFAQLGQLYRDAYELTVRRINEAGGVEAGDGTTYRLELDLRDDESDPELSVRRYRELVAQVDYLLGPYSSEITLAASDVAAEHERPMVQGSGASPEIYSAGAGWIFGLLPTADRYATATIEMAMAQPDPPQSAALLTERDPFSRSVATGAREKLAAEGVELVLDRSFRSGLTDFSGHLRAVADRDADLLLLSGHETHAIRLANQLSYRGTAPKLVMATVGSLTARFRTQAGPRGAYFCGPSPWNDTAEESDPVYGSTAGFVEAVESAHGYRPDYHSAAAAAAIAVYRAAFQRATQLGPAAVREALTRTSLTTAYGPVSFDDRGVIDRDLVVYQWHPRDGGPPDRVLVWPPAVREAPLVYPIPQ